MNEVDNRVVEMRFDNQQFEQNIAKSTQSLDRLKESLNLEGSAKGLEKLQNVGSNLKLDGVATAVEQISMKFSALEIAGITALTNITNKAVDAGLALTKSLTIDQLTAGWSKYEAKTRSVQTIMSATADEWEDQGEQMEFVNEQLEKLNWFTDETSYNFTDMTDNIGKFTSTGVDLEKATTAMIGIANAAAESGANAQAASRAMYNFSQALGMGSVKVQDWMSIENANMATKEFKETIIEAAKEVGTLSDAGDIIEKVGNYAGDANVTFQNFRSTLAAGWFTSDVLIAALNKYGNFANDLNAAVEATDRSATQLLRDIDAYKEGALNVEDVMRGTELSAEEVNDIFAKLASTENELGLKAFKAAQEAKTLSDALDATKDAASTAWLNIYELMFGDYLAAKGMWTDFANWLYDTFVSPTEFIFDTLEEFMGNAPEYWNETLYAVPKAITKIIDAVNQAKKDIFPALDNVELAAKKLENFFKKVDEGLTTFVESEEVSKRITVIAKGFFSILKAGGMIVNDLFQIVKPFVSFLLKIALGITDVTSALASGLPNLVKTLDTAINFKNISEKLSGAMTNAASAVEKFFKEFSFDKVKDFFKTNETILKLEETMTKLGTKVLAFGSKVAQVAGTVGSAIGNLFTSGKFDSLLNFANGGLLTGLLIAITKIGKKVKDLFSKDSAIGSIKEFFGSVGDVLDSFQKKANAEALSAIAKAIALLAGSFLVLSLVDPTKVTDSLITITVLMGELIGMVAIMGKLNPASIGQLTKMVSLMAVISASMLVLSVALRLVATASPEKMLTGLVAISGLMAGLVIFLKQTSKLSNAIKGGVASILAVAVAVGLMSTSLLLLGNADLSTIAKGLGAIGGILALILGFETVFKKMGGSAAKGMGSLVLLSIALIGIANAMKKIAGIDINELAKSFVFLTGILAELLLFTKVLSDINTAGLIKAVVSFTILSGSLIGIAAAMKIFGSMSWKEFGVASLSLLTSLTAISIALALMKNSLAGAAALAVVSVSLIAFSAAFKSLGKMDMKSIGKAFLALAGSLIIFAGAAALLTPIIPSMLALAGSFALMSVGTLALAAGILILNTALASFPVAAAALVTGLTTIVFGIIALGPKIVEAATQLITGLAQGLINSVDSITEATTVIVTSILTALNNTIPQVIELATNLVLALLQGIGLALPTIVNALFSFVVVIINGLADAIRNNSDAIFDAIDNLIGALGDFILAAIQNVVEKIPLIGDLLGGDIQNLRDTLADITKPEEAAAMSNDFTSGLSSGVQNGTSLFGDSMQKLGDTGMEKLTSVFNFDSMFDTGIEGGEGFSAGLLEGSANIEDITSQMGLSAFTGLNDSLGIHSPSTKFTESGEYCGDGLINGLNNKMEDVRTASQKLSVEAVAGIKDKYSSFVDAGKYVVDGFINGMSSKVSAVTEKAKSIGTAASTALNQSLKIASPSKITEKTGGFFGQGFINGIQKLFGKVKTVAANLGGYAAYGLNRSFSNLENGFNASPTIRPVFDMGNVQNGIGFLDNLTSNKNISSLITGSIGGSQYDILNELTKLRSDIRELNETVKTDDLNGIPMAIQRALSGMSINMSRRSVGKMVTDYQQEYVRSNGNGL